MNSFAFSDQENRLGEVGIPEMFAKVSRQWTSLEGKCLFTWQNRLGSVDKIAVVGEFFHIGVWNAEFKSLHIRIQQKQGRYRHVIDARKAGRLVRIGS